MPAQAKALYVESAELTRPRERLLLAALLCLALAGGIYLIASCTLISEDGVLFIHQAQQLQNEGLGSISKFRQHPGYPAMIWGAHTALKGTLAFLPQHLQWAIPGQLVALLSRLAALCLAYSVAKCLAGPRAALAGLAIIAMLPRAAEYGSDVLSDWLGLVFVLAAFRLLLASMQRERPWRLAGVGVLAGAGYLIRPEALIVLLVAWPWIGWRIFAPSAPRPRGRLAWAWTGLLMTLLAGACVWLHVHQTGMLYPKHQLFPLAQAGPSSPPHDALNLAGMEFQQLWRQLRILASCLGDLVELTAGVPILFIAVGLVIVLRHRPGRQADRYFLSAALLVYLIVTLGFAITFGYISHRHLLGPVLLCMAPLGLGIQAGAGWLSLRARWLTPARLTWLVVAMVSIPLAVYSLQPIRHQQADVRQAITWLAGNTSPDEMVLVSDTRMTFYLDRPTHPDPFWPALGEHSTARDLWFYVQRSQARWAMVRHQPAGKDAPPLRPMEEIGPGVFTPVRTFRQGRFTTTIYAVDPSRLVPTAPARPPAR